MFGSLLLVLFDRGMAVPETTQTVYGATPWCPIAVQKKAPPNSSDKGRQGKTPGEILVEYNESELRAVALSSGWNRSSQLVES